MIFNQFFSWYNPSNSLVYGCSSSQSIANFLLYIPEVWLTRLKFRQEVAVCSYCNYCICTVCWPRSCIDSEVNPMWPETIAGSLVSAVACGRETNSKDRKHRRWMQQKKTFNICCLKAVSLLSSNESPFVVAELDVSTGQNNITLQTGSLKRTKAGVLLFLKKSSERL